MPSIPSYLIENMILDFYELNQDPTASEYVDIEVPKILNYIANRIYGDVYDPKGIQGNINTLDFAERFKISTRASQDYQKALEAREFERAGNHRQSINKWCEVFGPDFPPYG